MTSQPVRPSFRSLVQLFFSPVSNVGSQTPSGLSRKREGEKTPPACVRFDQTDSGVGKELTWSLCLIGSATLGLILPVWGVFELDYSITGPGYCLASTSQWAKGGLCVCVFWGLACMCVFSLTAESAETTDSPTGMLSKSLCMQIKNATINVAKQQGGPAGFVAPSILPPPTSSQSPPGFDVIRGRS